MPRIIQCHVHSSPDRFFNALCMRKPGQGRQLRMTATLGGPTFMAARRG
jgi:hypothetical protein